MLGKTVNLQEPPNVSISAYVGSSSVSEVDFGFHVQPF